MRYAARFAGLRGDIQRLYGYNGCAASLSWWDRSAPDSLSRRAVKFDRKAFSLPFCWTNMIEQGRERRFHAKRSAALSVYPTAAL